MRIALGTRIDPCTHVIPVLKALQGHPEAGALWEKMINAILVDIFGFQATTHERNLYRGRVDGKDVLICRQVDDFAIATHDRKTAELLIKMINSYVTTSSDGIGTKYNGVDIEQTREFIRLHCESYIDHMLHTHGWSTPGPQESDRHDSVPMAPSMINHLQNLPPGPAEGTAEHKALQDACKFSYCQILGEQIYAYIVAHVDIGYAVTLLSQFSQAPAKEHYAACDMSASIFVARSHGV